MVCTRPIQSFVAIFVKVYAVAFQKTVQRKIDYWCMCEAQPSACPIERKRPIMFAAVFGKGRDVRRKLWRAASRSAASPQILTREEFRLRFALKIIKNKRQTMVVFPNVRHEAAIRPPREQGKNIWEAV